MHDLCPEARLSASEQKSAFESSSLPRFQLRKRAAEKCEKAVGFNTVNSAFLSGIFADVALVAEDGTTSSKRPHGDDTRLEATTLNKRSRVSMTRSISRCARSVKNLAELISPVTCSTDYFDRQLSSNHRENSLHMQLSCLSSDAATLLAFPHLPATVSQSSCGGLTRNISDLQSSVIENAIKETYGWFIEMDSEGPSCTSANPYDPKTRLAFSAATAPCADNHDDEVEWAKAADTVDDVLGDFF